MTKQNNLISSIQIGSIFDAFVDCCTTNNYLWYEYSYPEYYSKNSTCKNYGGNFSKLMEELEFPECKNIPSYPVSNLKVDASGTFHLEIATSGFEKEEIEIQRKGTRLIISGKKKDKEKKSELKAIWKNIAERDFELEYQCNDEVDLDKIDIKLKNGILSIAMPLKETQKPINLKIG